jgi:hypothetical protein
MAYVETPGVAAATKVDELSCREIYPPPAPLLFLAYLLSFETLTTSTSFLLFAFFYSAHSSLAFRS